MTRRVAAGLASVPVLHALLLLVPWAAGPRIAAALAIDAIGAALLLSLSRRAEASPRSLPVEAAAVDPASAAAEAEPPPAAEPQPACSSEGGLPGAGPDPLPEIAALAEACLARAGSPDASGDRLALAARSIRELHELLSDAGRGSGDLKTNVDKINEIASNLALSAEQAFRLAGEVESKAEAMAAQLAASLAETEGLSTESKRISEILAMMSDIASTTSILSFNASIVAANAGAHGKPFAVVAKEMRKLSQSAEAALRDITGILGTIQEKVAAVAERIRSVNAGVLDEKQALVAVAGNLQGVMLANEVVSTVSGICAQESAEEAGRLGSLAERADAAERAIAEARPKSAEDLLADLRKIAGLSGR